MTPPGWHYLPAPLDVVQALSDRAQDDDVSEDLRILLETAARSLEATLERCVRLASVVERTEVGL